MRMRGYFGHRGEKLSLSKKKGERSFVPVKKEKKEGGRGFTFEGEDGMGSS